MLNYLNSSWIPIIWIIAESYTHIYIYIVFIIWYNSKYIFDELIQIKQILYLLNYFKVYLFDVLLHTFRENISMNDMSMISINKNHIWWEKF